MTYGIWLSWNNQQEGFELPILPAEIGASTGGDGASHDVFGLGKINVIKDHGLAEYTIESFFPANTNPFITAAIVLEPMAYVDYLMRWWETKRPIRFVYTGSTMEVNIPASIESFEWREKAGAIGDIEYTLKLKEYRFYAAQQVKVTSVQSTNAKATVTKSAPKRADDRVPPKTYTLAAGDSLWTVAQKTLGDGSRWKEIQTLNKISDAQTKTLRVGLVLNLPTSGKAYA
ncbi:LysM peptidoglycan-binding domain-containing protein [Cohnella thailandensis]|uniref:LysM peptidoglycan-binding domain-containing protein n=1 Tax=Cohnella thailandensis TaxID=557557 RepID=A0A841SQ80_9BACL|nr:LysM peptidoglycan-binding domain-containing protein [Cohnella thailandensis]MBB6632756.1 LysM peptidoglycan-binding domain-containing protein [Cohnella thailandensis]MBP1975555.1 LysM repeat protein [Cohnella thailandensis]